jgi:putative RecB family exonuclease
LTDYRSVSQVNEYEDCPHRYYLNRRLKAWSRPAAWFPQGLAVHEAAEAFEKSERTLSLEDTEEVYRESYVKHTNRMTADTPNFEYWFKSGPYGGEADIERRFGLGLAQVGRYVDYYTEQAPDEVIWITPDGTPAIELRFDIDLDGVKVRGFIDQIVMIKPKIPKPKSRSKKALAEYAEQVANTPAKPTPRDVKSGNKPGGFFQLGVYDVAVEELFGNKADVGDYWMGRTGKPTQLYDLSEWGREQVTEKFHEVDEGIRAERFDPKPSADKCGFCSVSSACEFRFSG